MTPLTSMWVASLVGALLFFVAGFCLARRHHGEAAAVGAAIPPRVPPPVVESSLPTAAAFPLDQLSAVASLRAQVNELRNALRDARVREQSHTESERELLRLRAERSALEQKVRRELAIEIESTRRKLTELDQLRDENSVLREQAAEAAAATARIAALEEELRDMRALGLAPSPPPRRSHASSALLRPIGEVRSTSEQLSGLLSRLRGKSMRAIALADDLGLPIVGLGDDTSSLAAFAGYMTDIGRKARDFLPLGSLRRVTIEDQNDGTITACPLAAGDSHIALVTLTLGPGPSARQMGDVLRSAASMIR
jgi:hypothetical protein